MSGKGDGSVAFTLSARPRDHTDNTVMFTLTDEDVFQVIKGGGASVQKSSQMPSFGTIANPLGIVLSEEDIWNVVSYIRTLHRPSESSEK